MASTPSGAARKTIFVMTAVLLFELGGGLFAAGASGQPGSGPKAPVNPATSHRVPIPNPTTVTHASGSSSLLPTVLLAVSLGVIGVALGRLSVRVRPATPGPMSGQTSGPVAETVAAVTPHRAAARPAPTRTGAVAAGEIDQLAMTCLHLADSVSSSALRADIDRGLRAAGYEMLVPTGEPFDPSLHDAVERRPTPDPRAHNVIAATYRPGCQGRGHLLRSPEVAVYRFDGGR